MACYSSISMKHCMSVKRCNLKLELFGNKHNGREREGIFREGSMYSCNLTSKNNVRGKKWALE